MGSGASIGDVTSRLTLDSAEFDAKLAKSGEGIDRHAALTEKASERARAAWEKELVAQANAQAKLDQVNRSKELAALKSDILARSLEHEAEAVNAAGHASVSQMQATSAAVRSLEGNPGIRAVERFLTTIPGVGKALMAAFPLIGAAAFGAVIVEMGVKVAEFIKKMNEMPDTIRRSFESLHLAVATSNDQLRLTNDELQNAINKLQGHTQNDLALELDETRIKADQLAKSLEDDAKKVKDLLAANGISQLAGFLGKAPTSSVAGSVNSFQQKFSDIGYARFRAAQSGDQDGVAAKDRELAYVRKQAMDWAQDQLNVRNNLPEVEKLARGVPGGGAGGAISYQGKTYQDVAGDQTGNKNILQGFVTTIQDSQDREQLTQNNGALTAVKKNEDDKKAASEAAKQAAAERLKNFEDQLHKEQDARGASIKQDYEFWEEKKTAAGLGAEQLRAIETKESDLRIQGARAAAEKIKQFQEQQKRQPSVAEGMDIVARANNQFREAAVRRGQDMTQQNVDSNQLAILVARNEARQREAELTDAAGNSITRYAAALELARVHATEFETEMRALESIRSARALQQQTDPTRENGKALAEAQAAIVEAQGRRQIQVTQDNVAVNGRDTSGLVGATDALEEFVRATRDSASELRNLTTNVLNGFNSEVVKGISGQRTSFGDFGAGIGRDVAGVALRKGEGSILDAIGFGDKKKQQPTGTNSDPIHVMVANIQAFQSGMPQMSKNLSAGLDTPLSSVPFSSLLPGGGSGSMPSVGSMLGTALSLIPGFASGGMIDPNQWAIVGEEGPELFHSGPGGHIVPNDKIGRYSGSNMPAPNDNAGGETHYHHYDVKVDAKNATDPAAVEAAVNRGIAKAAPHIAAAGVKASKEQRMRMPSSRRG